MYVCMMCAENIHTLNSVGYIYTCVNGWLKSKMVMGRQREILDIHLLYNTMCIELVSTIQPTSSSFLTP